MKWLVLLLMPTLAFAQGTVEGLVKADKEVTVSSPVLQEIIQEILVEEGSEVTKGQVIIQLRNQREVLAVQQAEKAIAQKEFVARGMQRLFKEDVGSEAKALETQADLDIAKLALEARKIELEEKTIRSPISGIVTKKLKEAGEAVDRMEKLMQIVNMDTVYVELFLNSNARSQIRMEQPVKVKVKDLAGAEFSGKVSFLAPNNDEKSATFRVKVQIENKDHRIKPYMAAAADFGGEK